jgi:hypothetical protein
MKRRPPSVDELRLNLDEKVILVMKSLKHFVKELNKEVGAASQDKKKSDDALLLGNGRKE